MEFNLAGKVVLITGASSGIGKSAALLFAKSGASVIVHYRSNKEEAEQVLTEINGYDGDHSIYQLDLLQRDRIAEMFSYVKEKYGRLDVLVNNAGYCPKDAFTDVTDEKLETTFAINFFAPFACGREAAQLMSAQGGGKILFVASVDADRPGFFRSHYASSKAAEINLVKNMALELAEHNIAVNAVSPGAIDTRMIASVSRDEQRADRVLQGIPMHRFGQPEEIAGMLVFLASDASGYTTGSVFTIDGGLSLMRGY